MLHASSSVLDSLITCDVTTPDIISDHRLGSDGRYREAILASMRHMKPAGRKRILDMAFATVVLAF